MEKEKKNKASGKNPVVEFFIAYPAVAIIIALVVLFSILSPNFFNIMTFKNAMKGNEYILIAAVAEGIVILTGGIDLSVSTVLAISAVTSTLYMQTTDGGPGAIVVGILVALVTGTVFGLFNGLMVGVFGMQPFIVTMGSRLVAEGVAIALTKSVAVAGPESVIMFGFKEVANIPVGFIISLIIIILVGIYVKQSRWGRQLLLLGANRDSARYCGFNAKKVELLAYTYSGLLSGLAGFFSIIVLGNALPTIGATNLLIIIGAVVLGGVSMNGGEGSVFRIFIGVALLAILSSGLNAVAVPYTTQMILQGLIIFVGYGLSVNITSKSSKAVK